MNEVLQQGQPAGRCPNCSVYSKHDWYLSAWACQYDSGRGDTFKIDDITVSHCHHCQSFCIWLEDTLLLPDELTVPPPNPDIPEEIQNDYLEAASVLSKSPKAAAALLRLCLQKLCKHLGEKGDNINSDIKSLVQKGLPAAVQQAMDSIRIVGNNAVHPGEIDPNENKENVPKLFQFINVIAQVMITQPKEIAAMYSSLPEGPLEAIVKRDQQKT